MPVPTYRFAPSPNGYLHLGHAYSAMLNAEMAQRAGGRFLLRIEDIDGARCRPEYEAAIKEDLAWLGLAWPEPVRRQSEHMDVYGAALRRLEDRGLVYASFETRSHIASRVAEHERNVGPWPRDPDGAPVYRRDAEAMGAAERERRRRNGQPYALRLDMQAALAVSGELSWTETGSGPAGEGGTIPARPQDWGDLVLARKNLPTSYHLSVVVDDAAQGVTDVVRGRDLFWATSVHRLLQRLLGLPAPRYHHHSLVLGEDGRKLSKSTGATSLRALREAGDPPSGMRRRLGLC